MSSGADVDLVLRLAETAMATMVELQRSNFSSGNKGFLSVRTRNSKRGKTQKGERCTLKVFELGRGDKVVQSVPPGETDL